MMLLQLVTQRLKQPYPSGCRVYERFGGEFFGQENREYCTQKCIIAAELELCGCVLNLHEYAETLVDAKLICNIFLACEHNMIQHNPTIGYFSLMIIVDLVIPDLNVPNNILTK